MSNIDSGIPLIKDYDRLLGTGLFKGMEEYSGRFLSKNDGVLENYGRKWTRDPLHQWSRQWEYPYVFSKINDYIHSSARARGGTPTRILDAGSGATFFPYYLAANMQDAQVVCIDQDRTLPDIYASLQASAGGKVKFELGSLHQLPFDDGEFDVVYCISVLEHTNNYHEIINEFRRVMKKDGILIVTFDISIDGNADIPPEGAKKLIAAVHSRFKPCETVDYLALLENTYQNNILSTHYISQVNKMLLPWRYPRLTALKSLRKLKIPKSLLLNLTVCCCIFRA